MIKEPKIKLEDILILNDKDFNKNNVCIVTGIGTGIGRAVALAAAMNNLTVVGMDINYDAMVKTVEIADKLSSKTSILGIRGDISDDKKLEEVVKAARETGKIKYIANIAGIQHIDSIENFPMEKYDLMQKVMLRAPFYLSKLSMPYMENGGVIGNMASIHAHICTVNKPAYNIVKFGLRGLTQSIAAEGKIRSFSISTGYVATPLALNQIPAQAKQRGITEKKVVQDVMLGKSRVKEMMNPVEVANLFVFGFSKYSKHLNGGDLLYDGGMVKTY